VAELGGDTVWAARAGSTPDLETTLLDFGHTVNGHLELRLEQPRALLPVGVGLSREEAIADLAVQSADPWFGQRVIPWPGQKRWRAAEPASFRYVALGPLGAIGAISAGRTELSARVRLSADRAPRSRAPRSAAPPGPFGVRPPPWSEAAEIEDELRTSLLEPHDRLEVLDLDQSIILEAE
jgi:hypothetical protein